MSWKESRMWRTIHFGVLLWNSEWFQWKTSLHFSYFFASPLVCIAFKKQPFSSMFQILSFKTLYNILAIASSIKDFLSKFDKIRSFLPIWAHLLNKSLMENFIFCAVWPFPWLPEFYWNKHFSMTFIVTIFIIIIAFFYYFPCLF